jgi:hypothetical protein
VKRSPSKRTTKTKVPGVARIELVLEAVHHDHAQIISALAIELHTLRAGQPADTELLALAVKRLRASFKQLGRCSRACVSCVLLFEDERLRSVGGGFHRLDDLDAAAPLPACEGTTPRSQ